MRKYLLSILQILAPVMTFASKEADLKIPELTAAQNQLLFTELLFAYSEYCLEYTSS